MSLEYDVRAARRAVEDLAASVAALRRHYGEHVDLARLAADTERVAGHRRGADPCAPFNHQGVFQHVPMARRATPDG